MNRREFLKASSAAGALAAGSGRLQAQAAFQTNNAGAEKIHPFPFSLASEAAGRQPLLYLENEHLSVQLFADATARIVSRTNQREWRMGPVAFQEDSEIDVGAVWVRTERSVCEQYPGRFRGRKEGDGIRFWLLGREQQVKGSFLVRVILDGPWIEFRLLEIEERLPSLSFPPPIESASLLLPMHLGRWLREPLKSRSFYTFFSHLNMRWFGGLDHNAGNQGYGWMALFPEENFMDSGAMVAEMSISPVWLKSLGQWKEQRAVRYRFLSGSYVDLATTYRTWAMERGIHRSLTEKLRTTPPLENFTQGRLVSMVEAIPRHGPEYDEDILVPTARDPLLGSGPSINFTHLQAEQCIASLKDAGVDRALVVVRGWIPGGYDYSHPDVWPPEPRLGSIPELEHLCAGRAGYTVALHDNYQDIYTHSKSWPHGVIQLRDGTRMPGGYWAGGQAYIVNARDGLAYARRNWTSLAQLRMKALYIDTTTAVQMYQSYQPGNTLTRTQDRTEKIALMQFFKSKGLVLGSEEGADFGVPYLDWNENRHARTAGESIPLWPLVFHDAVIGARIHFDREPQHGAAPHWLEDMLWGYAAYSQIKTFQTRGIELRRMAGQKHIDSWFRQISTAAMVNHRFLTQDNTLEETCFSNGQSMVVNFANEPQSYEDFTVPPHGYRIRRFAV